MAIKSKRDFRVRRHLRVRNKIAGTAERPRMAVFRSNKRMTVQFIDDDARVTLAGVSANGKNAEVAKALGAKAAEPELCGCLRAPASCSYGRRGDGSVRANETEEHSARGGGDAASRHPHRMRD